MVHTVLDGAKRMLAKPTIRKLPMTTKIIKKMYKHFKKQEEGLNLLTRRFLAMVLIGFAGFPRCEEVLKIRRCDVAFHLSYVAIFIQQSKNRHIQEWTHHFNRQVRNVFRSCDPPIQIYRSGRNT